MSDAAAFKATFSGLRSLADGDYRISFDFPGELLSKVTEILTQGGKPSAAKGTWFGIARLHTGGGTGEDRGDSLKSGRHALISETNSTEGSASGQLTRPARTFSQSAFLLCNQPSGRVFLEQRRRHAIPAANHINNTSEAKDVLRAWLGIESLSELDRDTAAADRWERVEADYRTWLTAARYVENHDDL